MTVLYIAGPMTGLPEYNYPAFNTAERHLVARGYEVLNPARRQVRPDWTWADYMRHAIRDVLLADGIAVLPGWHLSRGARLETDIAKALGIRIVTVEFLLHAEAAAIRFALASEAAACPICNTAGCGENDHLFAPRPGAAE